MSRYKRPEIEELGSVEEVTETNNNGQSHNCFSNRGKSDEMNPNCQ
jgi:hypothetical protein